jgi:pilus assembly protein CpaC
MIRKQCRVEAQAGFMGMLLFALMSSSGFAAPGAEDVRLTVGKSIVIDYADEIRQISTSNPDIVDASPVTTREMLVHGKGLGTATLIVWNKGGQRNFYNVVVETNLEPLRLLYRETFPNETIHVQSSKESLSLTGSVSSPAVAERATAMATPFAKTVVNNLQVAAPVDKQILVRVKFAELDRTRASQFGVNLVSTGATNTIGSISTGQFLPPRIDEISGGNRSTFSVSDALNIFAFRPDLDLAVFIKALQAESILQILAEPNLLTTNGKEASFLVGGEFPVPVLQGGANSGAVTVQFREFGIRLMFTPVATSNGTIRMHLRQEVSTLDVTNAVQINGFTIPALATRRAETDIELGEGRSFVVAGLLDNRETESYSKIPGLADLPILGALFKSRETKQSRTELVMIVTPEITQPIKPGEPAPLPYFPRDFLKPITPPATHSAVPAKQSSAQPSAKAKSGRRWFGLSKALK